MTTAGEVVRGGDIVGVGLDGDLGVDHHVLVVGVMQNDVRAHALAGLIVHHGLSAIVGQRVLHIVVQSAHEALGVEQLAEHQLAPIADLLVVAA